MEDYNKIMSIGANRSEVDNGIHQRHRGSRKFVSSATGDNVSLNRHTYRSLNEAAKDLGLKLPTEVSLTLDDFKEINNHNIVHVQILNSWPLPWYNKISGYGYSCERVCLYYIQDDRLATSLIMDGLIDNIKSLALTFSTGVWWYSRVGDDDLFFDRHSDSRFSVTTSADHTYLTYDDTYLIECSGIDDSHNSTAAIDVWQRWTGLKKLPKPGKVKDAAKSFWKHSGGPNPGYRNDSTDVHFRAATLAEALGYLSLDILRKLSNIYDNCGDLDPKTSSPEVVMEDLMDLGILDKTPTNPSAGGQSNCEYPFINLTQDQVNAFLSSYGKWHADRQN